MDLVATMPRPVSLGALVAAARETMADLLGLPVVPVMAVFADRAYREGRLVDAGRRLGETELAGLMIGEPIPGPARDRRSTCHYDFEVGDAGDGARLMVVDYSDATFLDEDDDLGAPVQAIFSPYRTCVGVVVATSLALGAARCSGGEFVDLEIMMLRPPESDPARVVVATRLAAGGDGDGDGNGGFEARCERYLRQFANLGGWPQDVTIAR